MAEGGRPLRRVLARRHGETHAAWITRWREAGIFLVWPPVLDGARPRPFRIGLGDELVELLDPERCRPPTLHWLIRAYTGSLAYLEALQRPGSRRHDMNGLPLEEVDEGHRQHARERLVDHARCAKAKHQAELDAKRYQGPAPAGSVPEERQMTITTYTCQDLTDHLIAWFLSGEGEELAEMIYKNCASSPHYPPLMTEQVIDRVTDGARMWCESGRDCEKIPRLTDDPNDIDWHQLAIAIVNWYRGPAPEGDLPAVMHPGWSAAYLARAWDRVDAAVKSA